MVTKGEKQLSELERWIFEGKSLPPTGSRFTGLGDLGKAMTLAAVGRVDKRARLAVFATKVAARNAIDNYTFFVGREAAQRVHYIPALDFDYYRGLLPNPETLCERNVGLFHALNDPNGQLFVTTLTAILQKCVPAKEFLDATKIVSPADEIDRDGLIHDLIEAGYQKQPSAYDPGIFAVRGGVIDVFCPLYRQPVRIEFFGDLVEEVRFFEPQSQRSLEKLDKVFLIPVGQSLVPHGEEFGEASLKVKARLDSLGVPKADRDALLEKVHNGTVTAEMAFLFPLLSKGAESQFAYFPKDALVFWDGKAASRQATEEVELPKLVKNYELFEKQPLPIAEKSSLFLSLEEMEPLIDRGYSFEAFEDSQREGALSLSSSPVSLSDERNTSKRSAGHPSLDGFARQFREWMDLGFRVHLVCHTNTHAERIQHLFEPYDISVLRHEEMQPAFPGILEAEFKDLHVWQGSVTQSQIFPGLRLVVLSEEEIFGQKKRVARSAAWGGSSDPNRVLSSFRDLKVGDLVVHRDQGIGRYLGLKSMNFLGCENDYVLLEYRDGDKLYIPVYRLNVLQKFVGGEGAGPVLDKLGGDRWVKARGKAEKAVAELAVEFLKIQAKRKLIPAYPFSPPGRDYEQFEMEFPFDETPDQYKAIADVMEDMGKAHPMDRLVCGDVGYGKTEVAMRAAYRCALDKKQVAILVPTTVLAFQHFENFKTRFRSTGARIEMISRLRTSAQVKKTLAELKEGKIDIVIGTHRLLSVDVAFRDLGLIVVDEEHRFGVVHKERLKKISESVHVLSLTATPIPRTLNMAMTGIKEISIITTPPPDRLSVRTFVCRNTDEVIAEAVTNELARGGQVFFVHNKIETLFKLSEDLKALLPKVKIEIAHGQMDGDLLETKMLSFYRGESQILLSTTIIESGLDISQANTIIIDRADHFGLAQLYQLRGRVGRSDKRAYCYLLIPGENVITDDAKQRLQVIQRYTDLGSGFSVASHDLEIRGAGDLLGKEQSGHLNAIGIDLYFELLEESIRSLRGEQKKIEIEPEINLKIAASFPTDYLPDVSERIQLYRRLSAVETEEAISEIEAEIRDRFGPLPAEVTNLLGLMKLKLHLKRLHVLRMSCGPKRTSLQFASSTPASPEKLVQLIQSDPKRYSVTPDQKLVFTVDETDWRNQLREVQRLATTLGVAD